MKNMLKLAKKQKYNRQLLDDYNIADLYITQNLKKLDEKDIERDCTLLTLVLLTLQEKNIISIGDEIKIISDNYNDLTDYELMVIDAIKNNVLDSIDVFNLRTKAINSCKSKNLIRKNHILIITVISGVLYTALFVNESWINLYGEIILSILYMFFCILPFVIIWSINRPYVLTTEGKLASYKLQGIKNYIHDFTLLGEKEYKEITLWDNYLIYAIMLGENKKIPLEIVKKL